METKVNGADLTINCNDGTLYYCNYLLQRVHYYDTMINGGFAESNTTEISFDYSKDIFVTLTKFIETGETDLSIELYELALIINYGALLNYIVKSKFITGDMILMAIAHKHAGIINKLNKIFMCKRKSKLNNDAIFAIYEFVTYQMPEVRIDFTEMDTAFMSKKLINLAIDNGELEILEKIDIVINNKRNTGKLNEFLNGMPSDIITYHSAPLQLAIDWAKANPDIKEEIINKVLLLDESNFTNNELLTMISMFVNNNDVIKRLMEGFWQ